MATTVSLEAILKGWVSREVYASTWASLVAGAGTNQSSADTADYCGYACTTSQTDKFNNLYRPIFVFDLAQVPAIAVISSALFKGDWHKQSTSSLPKFGVYDVSPASDAGLVTADYGTFGSVLYSDELSIGDIPSGGAIKTLTLTAAGIAALLTPRQHARLGLRMDYDVSNTVPPWTSGAAGWGWVANGEYADIQPTLEITYELPLADRTHLNIKDLPVTEAARNLEIETVGRYFVDAEGNFVYRGRYGRNP